MPNQKLINPVNENQRKVLKFCNAVRIGLGLESIEGFVKGSQNNIHNDVIINTIGNNTFRLLSIRREIGFTCKETADIFANLFNTRSTSERYTVDNVQFTHYLTDIPSYIWNFIYECNDVQPNHTTLTNSYAALVDIDYTPKNTGIMFRQLSDNIEECVVASMYFKVINNRTSDQTNCNYMIGRYSVLPYYNETYDDCERAIGASLVNSKEGHLFVANFHNWYSNDVLREYTPESWTDAVFFTQIYPNEPDDAQFVVKGSTNSLKENWNTHMFAANKEEVINVVANVRMDRFVGYQDIVVRRYVPLKTFEIGINGVRFTNEWRFFFYDGNYVAHGYYWNEVAENKELPILNELCIEMLEDIVVEASKYTKFITVDIGETETGEWILIELNDGQMSGLNGIDPNIFYKNLQDVVNEKTVHGPFGLLEG